MKFAAPYQLNCPIDYNKIDEFNIQFTSNSSFDQLKKFLVMYPEHRINIDFAEENYNITEIINLCKEFNNVYLRLKLWELEYLDEYEEEDINFFFDQTIAICNYSLLEFSLSHSTKGIYIMDDLTYNLPNVYEQCSKKGIELRIVLNEVPCTSGLSLICPSVQVYRPQDYDFLSQYYSVGEFNFEEGYDWERVNILYRKWYVDHSWNSDLKFMNQDLVLPYPTQAIPPELTKTRASCQHRCTVSVNNICAKCRRFLLMGYQNVKDNLVYEDNVKRSLPSLEEMIDTILISEDDKKE